jgi:hypothetical protein
LKAFCARSARTALRWRLPAARASFSPGSRSAAARCREMSARIQTRFDSARGPLKPTASAR